MGNEWEKLELLKKWADSIVEFFNPSPSNQMSLFIILSMANWSNSGPTHFPTQTFKFLLQVLKNYLIKAIKYTLLPFCPIFKYFFALIHTL